MSTFLDFNIKNRKKRDVHVFIAQDISGSTANFQHLISAGVADGLKVLSSHKDNILCHVIVFNDSAHCLWDDFQPAEEAARLYQPQTASGNTKFSSLAPVIAEKQKNVTSQMEENYILISDGLNNESMDDFHRAFKALENNKRFKSGVKACIAIGDNVDIAKLAEFCGSEKAVYRVHNDNETDMSILPRLIASVTHATVNQETPAAFEKDADGFVVAINQEDIID